MGSVIPRAVAAVAVAILLVPAWVSAQAEIEKRTFVSDGRQRTYYLFAPGRPAGSAPMPLIVTLHGSGRNGKILAQKWKDLADKAGIVVAGPDSTSRETWSIPEDGPEFLRDLVEALRAELPIDPRRVYLFGHSAGAVFAIQMGPLESEYFAAVAAHAGALESQYHSVFGYARRKIPVFLVVGTRDMDFLLPTVEGTRDALTTRGFPVELQVIRGHTHDYYGRAKDINARAWVFLSRHALPADPKYTPYAK